MPAFKTNTCQHTEFTAVLSYRLEEIDGIIVQNNPINANDPMGLESHIVRSGNDFTITQLKVHAQVDPGYPEKLVNQFMTNPSEAWTGKFPPFTSTFNLIQYNIVDSLPLNERSAINVHFINQATVPCGSAAAACTQKEPGYNWLVTVSNAPNKNSGAHEFANVMGESSLNPVGSANNITRWVTGGEDNRVVESANFNDLINRSTTPFGGAFIYPAAQPDISSNAGDLGGMNSAAGGYLIYPNNPNTNMMRSVYQK